MFICLWCSNFVKSRVVTETMAAEISSCDLPYLFYCMEREFEHIYITKLFVSIKDKNNSP